MSNILRFVKLESRSKSNLVRQSSAAIWCCCFRESVATEFDMLHSVGPQTKENKAVERFEFFATLDSCTFFYLFVWTDRSCVAFVKICGFDVVFVSTVCLITLCHQLSISEKRSRKCTQRFPDQSYFIIVLDFLLYTFGQYSHVTLPNNNG